MNFKKSISIILSFTLFFLTSCCCFGANSHNNSVKNFINAKNVKFVPDKDIVIDSDSIRKYKKKGKLKRITFVSPDKYSKSILGRKLFPNGAPKPWDIKQGQLGVCYFLSVLSALAKSQPDLLKKNLVDDGKGNVIVKFFHPENGKPFYIKVQKTVPNLPSNLKFIDNDCLWAQMYLKAFVASEFGKMSDYHTYGKVAKNYKLLEGSCYPTLPMRMLTGKDTEIEEFSSAHGQNDEARLYSRIKGSLSDSGVAVCDFTPELDAKKMPRSSVFYEGIIHIHAYSIEKVYKDSNGQKWLVMRNPWGCHVPRYSKGGKVTVDTSIKSHGCFKLKFKDFSSQPGRIYIGKNEIIKPKKIC